MCAHYAQNFYIACIVIFSPLSHHFGRHFARHLALSPIESDSELHYYERESLPLVGGAGFLLISLSSQTYFCRVDALLHVILIGIG